MVSSGKHFIRALAPAVLASLVLTACGGGDTPVVEPETEEQKKAREEEEAKFQRSEADLRGAITNDSMTDEEKRLYQEEQQPDGVELKIGQNGVSIEEN